eukprot:CAMPEP_0203787394 /NCGR_PEP_ID=MMETSP0100_2-20121128/2209_1 /ASSEMBLY_ACC=CAM_ASM_000210 /TAXON_ID=96639 /ORGANISM=" , Strain NY0313808BC1" /LENGTH=164 /DNA_ID=CAMNT_0050689905 /DNA_START=1002 /DNA_END=1493 /DNA_ORIENTATION=-
MRTFELLATISAAVVVSGSKSRVPLPICECDSTCIVYGDPHVIDFSGKRYHLSSKPSYNVYSMQHKKDKYQVTAFAEQNKRPKGYINQVDVTTERGVDSYKVGDCKHQNQVLNINNTEHKVGKQVVNTLIKCTKLSHGPFHISIKLAKANTGEIPNFYSLEAEN